MIALSDVLPEIALELDLRLDAIAVRAVSGLVREPSEKVRLAAGG